MMPVLHGLIYVTAHSWPQAAATSAAAALCRALQPCKSALSGHVGPPLKYLILQLLYIALLFEVTALYMRVGAALCA
jgi:hypothetical protein